MNKRSLLIFSLLIILLLVLAACGKEPPKECETAAQCMSQGECYTASCSPQGKCVQVPKTGCCGNMICEKDSGENVCSCEKDCKFDKTESGLCEGKVKLENSRRPGTFYDATYAQYFCDHDECVAGVPPKDIEEVQLLSDLKGDIYLEVVTKISKPFVVNKGELRVRVTMRDLNTARARGPVRFTGMQVLAGSELIAEKPLDETLTDVNDYFEADISLKPVLDHLEEEKDFNLRMNYEAYTYNPRDDSTTLYRTYLQTSYRRIPFVDPSKAE